MTGAERIAEASEGIGYLRAEIVEWVRQVNEKGPPGAHLTRLATLRKIIDPALDAIAAELASRAGAPLGTAAAYALASVTDKRVLFCRRLFRWYALRFGQRGEARLRQCLAGADEVVWSTWERTFAAARAPRIAAPLCFVDNDPIPWASPHQALPPETSPPPGDVLLAEFTAAGSGGLPVPVIGLPPVVARRPWWLVTVIHETGHHVLPALAGAVPSAVAGAAARAGAGAAEQQLWSCWSAELFADAYASAFAGASAAWAVAEYERGCADPFAARATYPPAEVRLRIVSALVAQAGGGDPGCTLTGGAPAANPKTRALSDRVPAVVGALLDCPIGRTSLRELAGDGQELAETQARWAAQLRAGKAHPSKTLEAAAACVGGAVRAWRDSDRTDPAVLAALRDQVLEVLPQCRPDDTRAAGPDDPSGAARALIGALLGPGARL